MPNWCQNTLYIRGERKEIQRFLKHIKTEETDFDFEKIIPYPEKFRKLDRIAEKVSQGKFNELTPEEMAYVLKNGGKDLTLDGYNQGGYEWCVSEWGTKWNACEPSVGWNNDNEAVIGFDTAWSPPCPVILKASEMFPKLEFELQYCEEGVGFCGVFIARGGKVIKDKAADYVGGEDDEDAAEKIIERLKKEE